MASEVFVNVGESTLAAPALSTDTTLTLLSGAPFPATGQYRIRLDDSLQQPGGIATRYEIARATFNAGNVINGFRTGVDLEGTTAQGWPIGTAVRAIITAAALAALANSCARGTLPGGFVQGTANVGSIVTATSSFSGVPVTIAAGRRIKITAFEPVLASSVANDMFLIKIYDGATEIGAAYAASAGAANEGSEVTAMAVVTPSAGSHSYGTTATRVAGTGTGTLTRTATEPAFLLIEDIGV